MDISSDLTEFAKSPVAVVCAGAKSILDIPRTLEYLETMVMLPSDMQSTVRSLQISCPNPQPLTVLLGQCMSVTRCPVLSPGHSWELYLHQSSVWQGLPGAQGITVAALGTDEFPAFFTPRSGCRAPARVDSPQEAARLIKASQQLSLGSGVLIGTGPPPPWHCSLCLEYCHHPDSQAQETRGRSCGCQHSSHQLGFGGGRCERSCVEQVCQSLRSTQQRGSR